MGCEVDKGANIVTCVSCGATKDLEEDSSTCFECLDPDAQFEPRYNLARDIPWRADVARAGRGEWREGGEGCGVEGAEASADSRVAQGAGDGARKAVGGKTVRERERELWLEQERERAKAGLTIEDLLPSGIFRSLPPSPPPPPPLPAAVYSIPL